MPCLSAPYSSAHRVHLFLTHADWRGMMMMMIIIIMVAGVAVVMMSLIERENGEMW